MRPVNPAKSAPTHFIIPDTQVDPGVPTDHLRWIGQYIWDQFVDRPNFTVIHLGDHWNMGSLSTYDKGKKRMEGRRYTEDIEAGNVAFALITEALERENAKRRRRHAPEWWPRLVFITGNHENRITRAAEDNAQLEGTVSLDDLDTGRWEVIPFLDVFSLDGVAYSHYFYNPSTGRPFGGMVDTRIRQVGRSFTMGHQQGLKYGLIESWTDDGRRTMRHGLIAGSCYLHDEDYMGPQGNAYWRGVVVCHDVKDGSYDPMFLRLDYLSRRYEGKTLDEFLVAA